MKLETLNSSVEVKTNMQMGNSIKAELAADKLHKMWDLLQSPYRDPISSLIREYVSNAFDSHIEAGVDTPVYVTLEQDQSGWYWACEDFGVGLSEERCKEVFMKYLTSTKEDTNDQIGAFGMGSKSGLGYTDVVHIRTRFDGFEYQYMLHKTSDAPTLSLLGKKETTNVNGTQIKIYLKDDWREVDNFIKKTGAQLAYFDNVTYGGKLSDLDEDFVIYRGKTFAYRQDNRFKNGLHILIGKVAYPINWDSLNMSGDIPDDMRLALTFEIGDLPVIFTREDIRYTDKAVKVIKDKIAAFEAEILEMITPESKDTDDIFEYNKFLRRSLSVKLDEGVEEIPSSYLVKQVDLSGIKYTPNPHLDKTLVNSSSLDSFFQFACYYHGSIKNGRYYKEEAYNRFSRVTLDTESYYRRGNCILADGPSEPRKNRYICTQGRQSYKTLLRDNRKNLTLEDYKKILHLTPANKSTWRDQIKWYQALLDEHFDKLYDLKYSEIIVPDEFEKKPDLVKQKVVLDNDTLRVQVFRSTDVSAYDDNIQVTSDTLVLKISDLKGTGVIWSTRENKDALRCTFSLLRNFSSTSKYKVIAIAQRDIPVMEELSKNHSNIKSLDDWYLDPKNEIFEAFVFFSKFGRLVNWWKPGDNIFRKPKVIPYLNYVQFSGIFCNNMPNEFSYYLLQLFDLQGKKLNLGKLKALTSWYSAESSLENLAERLECQSREAKTLLAIHFFPNRPLVNHWKKIKNIYLSLKP